MTPLVPAHSGLILSSLQAHTSRLEFASVSAVGMLPVARATKSERSWRFSCVHQQKFSALLSFSPPVARRPALPKVRKPPVNRHPCRSYQRCPRPMPTRQCLAGATGLARKLRVSRRLRRSNPHSLPTTCISRPSRGQILAPARRHQGNLRPWRRARTEHSPAGRDVLPPPSRSAQSPGGMVLLATGEPAGLNPAASPIIEVHPLSVCFRRPGICRQKTSMSV